MDIDIEKIVKEAIIESFDGDNFIERLSLDINESNPEWWAEKIVYPLRKVLEKSIIENKDFVKEIIWEYMDREFYEHFTDKINSAIWEYAKQKVDEAMPKLKIAVEKDDDTKD